MGTCKFVCFLNLLISESALHQDHLNNKVGCNPTDSLAVGIPCTDTH